MKIRYAYPPGQKVVLKAPQEVIHAWDAELTMLMCEAGNAYKYPHLKQMWFYTVGKGEREKI